MILIRSLWIANKPTADGQDRLFTFTLLLYLKPSCWTSDDKKEENIKDFFIYIVFCLAPPMLCVYSGGRVNNFRSQREEEF